MPPNTTDAPTHTSKQKEEPMKSGKLEWSLASDAYLLYVMTDKFRPKSVAEEDWEEIAKAMGEPWASRPASVQQHFNKVIKNYEFRRIEGESFFKLPCGGKASRKRGAEEQDGGDETTQGGGGITERALKKAKKNEERLGEEVDLTEDDETKDAEGGDEQKQGGEGTEFCVVM